MEKSLFESVDHPYYISALDYRNSSAGIRALHYLCHALNELGQEAYIICDVFNSKLRTPKLTEDIVIKHKTEKRVPIVLYPEVVHGNPLNLPVVARWLLNKPGYLGGDEGYHNDEVMFFYQKGLMLNGMKGDSLYIPTIDCSIFHNDSSDIKREGSCYYASKYLLKGGELTSHVKNSISLCHDVLLSPKEIADIFRKSEVLYCYEPTAIINEALLCGCPVVIIPTEYSAGFDNEFFGEGAGGVAMGCSEAALLEARKSVLGLSKKYNNQIKRAWFDIENFSQKMQHKMQVSVKDDVNLTSSHWDEDVLAALLRPPYKKVKKGLISFNTNKNNELYSLWKKNREINTEKLNEWQEQKKGLATSVHYLVIISQGEEGLLASTIDSLATQIYTNWHLVLFLKVQVRMLFLMNMMH